MYNNSDYKLSLLKHSTYFTIDFNNALRDRHLRINNIIRSFLKQELTALKYHARYRRWIPQYMYYLVTSDWYRLPIAYFPKLCRALDSNQIKYVATEMAPVEHSTMGALPDLRWSPREIQLVPLDFLSEGSRPQSALSLATGNGKTFTAIRSALNLNQTTLILCTGLIEVWYNSILAQTNCSKDDVWIMQGYATVHSLNSMVDNGYKPKFVIASIPTVYNFILRKNKYEYIDYTFSELVEKIGFGTKIIDECHQRLSQLVTIDLVANIKNNIYLSATYLATNKIISRIFNTIFNKAIKLVGAEGIRHCNIERYTYHVLVSERKCKTSQGYNHAKYEQYILKRKTLWAAFEESVLRPIVISRFIRDRRSFHRGLIFCSTFDMADRIIESIRKAFPEIRVARYFSSKGDKIDDTLYNKAVDLCVTTPGSSGTGKDIPDLWFILNTISFSSELMAIQMIGRLRPLDGFETRFIDISNDFVESHKRHLRDRNSIWNYLGLSCVDYNIP